MAACLPSFEGRNLESQLVTPTTDSLRRRWLRTALDQSSPRFSFSIDSLHGEFYFPNGEEGTCQQGVRKIITGRNLELTFQQ